MNSKTTLVMFAVVAALAVVGLAAIAAPLTQTAEARTYNNQQNAQGAFNFNNQQFQSGFFCFGCNP